MLANQIKCASHIYWFRSEHDGHEHKPIKTAFTKACQQMETKDKRSESPSGLLLPSTIITGVQWLENHESSVSGSDQSFVRYT